MNFNIDNLKPADILVGRNEAPDAVYARRIRALLGCWSNHNALIVPSAMLGGLCVGDTIKPCAQVVPLSHYEDLINAGTYKVRIWRVKDLTDAERLRIAVTWYQVSDARPYADYTIAKLAIFRIVNSLPWRLKIKGTWCSENTARPFTKVLPMERDPVRKLDPPLRLKKHVTPATYRNRLECGILEDVTDRVIDL